MATVHFILLLWNLRFHLFLQHCFHVSTLRNARGGFFSWEDRRFCFYVYFWRRFYGKFSQFLASAYITLFAGYQRLLCAFGVPWSRFYDNACLRVEQAESLRGNEFLRSYLIQCALLALGFASLLVAFGQQRNCRYLW